MNSETGLEAEANGARFSSRASEAGTGLEIRPRPSRVVVIGAGLVGSTYAYTLLVEEVADEISLVDVMRERAAGQALDLSHAVPFARQTRIWAGSLDDAALADVVVVAAGASQKPGQTRMDLLVENSRIVKEISSAVGRVARDAVILVVTNPVDVMSYVAWKASGLPACQVMGSGTLLDTARLRWSTARELGIDPRSVHVHVVGEHGDTETVAWSLGNVAGIPLNSFEALSQARRQELFEEVRDAAYHIIDTKGASYFAIALALTRLTQAILKDSRTVFCVSTLLDECLGVREVFAGMPCVIGRKGIVRVLKLPVAGEEARSLRRSLYALKQAQEAVAFDGKDLPRTEVSAARFETSDEIETEDPGRQRQHRPVRRPIPVALLKRSFPPFSRET